jgi:hypothetical protein
VILSIDADGRSETLMNTHGETAHKKYWQAVAMGTKPQKDRIPIAISVYRNVAKGTGMRIMARDETNRKKFSHPMFPRTFLSIDEATMSVEIAADSESYLHQLASDLALPRYKRD